MSEPFARSATRRRLALLEELRCSPGDTAWAARHADLADELVADTYAAIQRESSAMPGVSVIATGGYGRRELAPYSDIDISVVPLEETDPSLDGFLRSFFQQLHVGFGEVGLMVGYAYRLVMDVEGLDPKSRAALLDARLVAGAPEPFDMLVRRLVETFPTAEFLIDRLSERQQDMLRTNDTPLAVEPNLKLGAGGMRCHQTAHWIRWALEMPKPPRQIEYQRVLAMRNALHLVAGRKRDEFTRPAQAQIGDLLGADIPAVCSALASDLASVHETFLEACDLVRKARFKLARGVHAVEGALEASPEANSSDMAIGVMLAVKLGIEVGREVQAGSEHVDGPLMLSALAGGEATLRALDRCGHLAQVLPELAACRTLMPGDPTHHYSIFEHTLRAIRALDQAIARESFIAEVRGALPDLKPLYLALLLHDTGKALDEPNHSEVGACIAREVAARWGLDAGISELVEWLVREHLSLSRLIGMRDVHRPETASELASIVGTHERLSMLTLLTYADTKAVGALAWTAAQDTFLRDLYWSTLAVLRGEDARPHAGAVRSNVLRSLSKAPVPPADLARFVSAMPVQYLASVSADTLHAHFNMVERAAEGEVFVEVSTLPELSASRITVCCLDRPGALTTILAGIYALDLGLLSLRANSTAFSPAVLLDDFVVNFGGQPLPPATAERLRDQLAKLLAGSEQVESVLRAHGKDPSMEQRLFDFRYLEGEPGILELSAPRGRGMAYRFARLIARQGWNILAARASQWAGRGVAAFYISDAGGSPLTAAEVEPVLRSVAAQLAQPTETAGRPKVY